MPVTGAGLGNRWLQLTPARIGLVALLGVIMAWQLDTVPGERSLLNRLEFLLYDARMQWTLGAQDRLQRYWDDTSSLDQGVPAASPVAVIDIDEAALLEFGRWPWSREQIARLLNSLQQAGAVVVAFDMVFAEPELPPWHASRRMAQQLGGSVTSELQRLDALWQPDRWLATQMQAGDTVLGFFMHPRLNMTAGQLPPSIAALSSTHVLPRADGYTATLPLLHQSATAAGFVTTFPDSDGVIRRTPLLIDYQHQAYPSLALAAVMTYLLLDKPELSFSRVGNIEALTSIRLTEAPIYPDATGRVLVPFFSESPFPVISAASVMAAATEEPAAMPDLTGRIVFVGTSAIGLADLVSTPLGTGFPGVAVQARVAERLLAGGFPYRPVWEPAFTLVQQLLVSLIALILFARRLPWRMLTNACLLMASVLLANSGLWWYWQLDLPIATTLLLVFVIFGWCLLLGYVREAHSRRQIRTVFGQYLPPAHIEQLVNAPQATSMAGESRELTVLFSDIRGFTTISEQLSATDLKALLNRYFTPITAAIFRHDGTIDKYVGDMVMAFWGAPVADRQHRCKAIRAALEMQALSQQLSHQFAAEGLPAIRVGIGLNTGWMNVGDMGSQYRKAYTVLGDAVNLGSRLESLTKYYGVDILVAESTLAGLDEFVFRFCDRLTVKGKAEPVNAFEVVGFRADLDARMLKQLNAYDNALHHYRNRQWGEADRILRGLQREDPNCRLYALYRERISALRQQWLPAEWDGVFRHTAK